jgi:ABC-type uncharacterized transport system substrate-binding protein
MTRFVAGNKPATPFRLACIRAIPSLWGWSVSLARPGANVTGLSATTADLSGKNLELIREVLPLARRVAVVATSDKPVSVFTVYFLRCK